jgi:hypothetical protein
VDIVATIGHKCNFVNTNLDDNVGEATATCIQILRARSCKSGEPILHRNPSHKKKTFCGQF